jgi:hypothetical protein
MFDRIMQERKRRRGLFYWLNGQKLGLSLAALAISMVVAGYWLNGHPQGLSKSSSLVVEKTGAQVGLDKVPANGKPQVGAQPEISNLVVISKSNVSGDKSNAVVTAGSLISTSTNTKSNVLSDKSLRFEQLPTTNYQLSNSNPHEGLEVAKIEFNPVVFPKYNTLVLPTLEGLMAIPNPLKPLDKCRFVSLGLKSGDPDYGCPGFGKRHSKNEDRMYFDIYGAPTYPIRTLINNTGNVEKNVLLNARDSMEKSWYGFAAGMRLSYVFGNGLAIRGGVHYAQNNEILTYNNPSEIRTTTTIVTVFNPVTGKTDTSTQQVQQIGIRTKTTYNRYRSIDIPIQLGYEWKSGESGTFSLNGGVNINFASWRTGDIIGSDLKPTNVTSELDRETGEFKKTVGLSIFASLAYYHDIGNDWQLMIEPHVLIGMSPITQSFYPISQSYLTPGLILGLRKGF